MLIDVVAPYAHGAYTRVAKKIQRDAARQMREITGKNAELVSSDPYQRPLPNSIVYKVFNTIIASSFSE